MDRQATQARPRLMQSSMQNGQLHRYEFARAPRFGTPLINQLRRSRDTAAPPLIGRRPRVLFRFSEQLSQARLVLQHIYKANTVVLIEKLIRSISRCICNLRFSLDSRVPMNAKEEFRGKNEKRRGYRFSKNLNNIDLKVFLSWRRSVAKNGRGGRDGVV